MAYTAAQLVAAYTAANDGIAPDTQTVALLEAFAEQTQSGRLADNMALAHVIDSATAEDVAVVAYAFFTGKRPSLEDRYINFAAGLGITCIDIDRGPDLRALDLTITVEDYAPRREGRAPTARDLYGKRNRRKSRQ